MRSGKKPSDACKQAVEQIKRKLELRNKNPRDVQIGFIAINKLGEYGAFALQQGFNFAVKSKTETKLVEANYLL
jgi:N4-(beta-N-acetylglucosaminyl)-L-asparaginase